MGFGVRTAVMGFHGSVLYTVYNMYTCNIQAEAHTITHIYIGIIHTYISGTAFLHTYKHTYFILWKATRYAWLLLVVPSALELEVGKSSAVFGVLPQE